MKPGHPDTYEVICQDGRQVTYGEGHPAFRFIVKDLDQFHRLIHGDPYTTAIQFIDGRFDIQGDLIAAIRLKAAMTRRGLKSALASSLAWLAARGLTPWSQAQGRDVRDISFHYDRSNEFYRAFLDERMVYSCAYFRQRNETIEEAQLGKMDHICKKLDLRPGDRFLDVGSGWGGLVIRAAGKFGAVATGCTLSHEQAQYASAAVAGAGLQKKVVIRECDFRLVEGQFDKIASVGMFEHVGRRRLRQYFRTIYALLKDDGLFLNHGIIRPECVKDGPETLFLQRHVFPGGELAHLSEVVRAAELAGFEILDVENLRPHYALTCRRWVERLQQNAVECRRHVDSRSYKTWLLYLAASAFSFETGSTEIHQILMAKRGESHKRRLTRDYMYV